MQPPALHDLAQAVDEAEALLLHAQRARSDRWVNREGGDVASTGNRRSLVRHVANYLAAAEAARSHGSPTAELVDVGSGTGALGVWLAARLGARLHLVDADPQVRAVAVAAFPGASVHTRLADPPRAPLVTAMEVVEHVVPAGQPRFVRDLYARVAPGGLLVMSTPDETRYLGGWSGYAPHVGVLDADRLRVLLTAASGGIAPTVWRLNGPPFHVGPLRRVAEPVGNRLLAQALTAAPRAVERVAAGIGVLAGRLPHRERPPAAGIGVAATPATVGDGSGLLAVLPRPA